MYPDDLKSHRVRHSTIKSLNYIPLISAIELALLRIRKMVLALFCLSSLGLLMELYLLDHYEDYWQLLPIILLMLAFLVGLFEILLPNVLRMIWLKIICAVMVASSVLGMGLHFKGNRAFELEMYPDLSGWELFEKTITGATPALSPAALFVLGALGWIYTLLLSHEFKIKR